ncbi:hypothetical protein B0A55_05032 [Friedmanniomyces simplex]|uniref:RecA family profile 1 domain-containing protein n=1 Tax=Friedmanniomyces simplex TaxID=329884 RepID=A0A4U0XHM0_9PEZI|nr:hypothetical protein B0A55_05032 [Friedmanniomyces simplex]
MTNLLTLLPDFDLQPYTHILPSLEKALISTVDLLTLDALDVAKRAQVPPGEVKKLAAAVLDGIHASTTSLNGGEPSGNGDGETAKQQRNGSGLSRNEAISTLDDALDAALCGGIAVGKVTEFVGESAAGKTQFLLTLLLSVQLSPPHGLNKSALYISTEAPLPTPRLAQILQTHPTLSSLTPQDRPTMARVQSAHIHDLEAQDHILRYQVPVVLQRHDIGLLVIDSIAANYRPEFDRGRAANRSSAAESFVTRSNQVTALGALLREIAERYGIAVVVANQVADRFATVMEPASQPQTQKSWPTSPPYSLAALTTLPPTTTPDSASTAPPAPPPPPALSTPDPLALDHQQRFFTGWGDAGPTKNPKTPSLGLAWTNQLAARIALVKEEEPVCGGVLSYSGGGFSAAAAAGEEEMGEISGGWRRRFRVVFGGWCGEGSTGGTGFEIWSGGVRAIAGEQRKSSEDLN